MHTFRITALFLILTASLFGEIINRRFTITALTPLNVASGLATASDGIPLMARNVLIQMRTGGTGRGYIMAGIKNQRIPVAATAIDLSAELAPATATAPGGSWSRRDPIDLARIWIDGSNTGDTVTISYEVD